MWYQAKGRVEYNGDWIIIRAHNSIVWYYKWWVERLHWKKISTPLHGAHITVLAGKHEKPRLPQWWKKYDRQYVDFEYSNVVMGDGKYYWLTVRCPMIKTIRNELGLNDGPKWLPHLTIGYRE